MVVMVMAQPTVAASEEDAWVEDAWVEDLAEVWDMAEWAEDLVVVLEAVWGVDEWGWVEGLADW
jgi:hypothetical protein